MSIFDLMGPEVKLSINSKEKLSSQLGVLTSILFFLISCGSFVGFGKDIFFRSQPKVTFNRAIIEDQEVPVTSITDNNFLFVYYDQFTDTPIPDFYRRYTPSFDYYNVSSGEFQVESRIPFEKCSENTLNKWKGNFALVGPSNYLCFPKNKTWNLSGIVMQGAYTSIRMQLLYCQNNTDSTIGPIKTDCIPKEDTVKFLIGKRIQMHYIIESSLVDSYNYTNPQIQTSYTGYANTDPLTWSRLTIFFKTINTDTDEGFFIETRKTLTFSAIESIQPEAIYSPDTNSVFSHIIGNSRYKEKTTRVYIKVQDIFAMMGGFINAALIILRLIVRYFKRPEMVNLFNNILRYEKSSDYELKENNLNFYNNSIKHIKSNIHDDELDDPYVIKKNISNANLVNHDGSIHNKIRNPIENLQLVKEKEEDFIKEEFRSRLTKLHKTNYSFSINSCIRIFKCCISNKNISKIELYNKVEKKMIKTISFENLIKLTRYSKLLREIILNETQTEIYNYCYYPKNNNISKKKLSIKDILENFKENKYDKVDLKLIEYINNCPARRQNNFINK